MTKRKPAWKTIAKRHFGRTATHYGGDGQFAFVTPCKVLHLLSLADKRRGREKQDEGR